MTCEAINTTDMEKVVNALKGLQQQNNILQEAMLIRQAAVITASTLADPSAILANIALAETAFQTALSSTLAAQAALQPIMTDAMTITENSRRIKMLKVCADSDIYLSKLGKLK